jgi:outer membrane protein
MKVWSAGACFVAAVTLALDSSACAAQGSESDARPTSLNEAVRLAQRNSPTTTFARGQTRVSRASVSNSLAQFLPNIFLSTSAQHSAGASYFQGKLVPFAGDPWSYRKGYSANLTLWDWGQRWFTYRAAQSNLTAGSDNEVLQRFTVTLSVKQQYYNVLAARETEAAAQRQLENAETQLKVTSARLQAGAANRLDSLRTAVIVGQARLAIINAQNSLRVANATLTRLAASPVPITAIASDTAEVPTIDVDSATLVRLASEGPAVRQAQSAFGANQAARRASLTAYLPTLTMFYQGGSSKTTQTFAWDGAFPSTSKGYGFTLSYPLFNNFNRELQTTQALVNEDNAEASLRDAKFAARENLATYLATFSAAMQTIELQNLQISAAEEDLRGQQDRYRLGAGTPLLDVINAQNVLDSARLALINARLQARTAKAQIEALIGRELGSK